MARKGLYVYPSGISPQCSGLEIKESQTEKQKKEEKRLKGFFVPGAGFTNSYEAALNKAEALRALQSYQLRLFRFGLIV